jgi:hypothetical protein
MLMPQAEYILISNGGEPYVQPEKPNAPVYNGTATAREQQKEDYRAALTAFLKARDLQARIRKVMVAAIPDAYMARLRQPMGRYSDVNPRDMLTYLKTTYGTIKPKDLVANMERINKPWDPDTAIEYVFTNGDDCRQFAIDGGNSITDASYMQILLNTFKQSVVMDDTLKTWAMKGTANHTVDNMREHFMMVNEYERDNKAPLKGTMAANAVNTTTTQAPTQQNRPNTLDGYYYCWTHGVATHTGANC